MNAPYTTPGKGSTHPMMIIAAIAVVLFCLAGTAAIMGWIPTSIGGNTKGELSEADRAALASQMQAPPASQLAQQQPLQPIPQTAPRAPAEPPLQVAAAAP